MIFFRDLRGQLIPEDLNVWGHDGRVTLKDSTMREGLDVPGVKLNPNQKKALLAALAETGVPEVEIVAPGRFESDLESLKQVGRAEGVKLSGLVYAHKPRYSEQLERARGTLDRVDLLMPLSELRPPADKAEKQRQIMDALRAALDRFGPVGVGFPHALHADRAFMLDLCRETADAGAGRITLYDTNGGAFPWEVEEAVLAVRGAVKIEICFHAHNDLGMATANAVAAARAGAGFLDVTVNGLGDRAGNASLEQVAVALQVRGVTHGLRLDRLRKLSGTVEAMTRVPVSKLAPVVGDFAFRHKSPDHLSAPALFEAYDPSILGAGRTVDRE